MKITKVYKFNCDRCGKQLLTENKITIFVQKGRTPYRPKEFDLCLKCYEAMVRGIQKGKKVE